MSGKKRKGEDDMVNSEKKMRNPLWLQLRDYQVMVLKPEFDQYAVELESAIYRGVPAYPDLARADFYDVMLEDGWAYIHVYRDGQAVYLVGRTLPPFGSFSNIDCGHSLIEHQQTL
jgi:hypothetical protein